LINLTLVGEQVVALRLKALPAVVQAVITAKVTALTLKLEARVKQKLSGEVLNVRSGNLRRSIFQKVEAFAHSVIGKVMSAGDVKYARIHELGGVTKPHVIEPRSKQALAFSMFKSMGSWGLFEGMVIAKKVNHPGSRIPKRSFMASSLKEQASDIMRELKLAAIEGARLALNGGTA